MRRLSAFDRLDRSQTSFPLHWLFMRLHAMVKVIAERRRLSQLTDYQLRDIGISKHEAIGKAMRPPWDLPANWQERDRSRR